RSSKSRCVAKRTRPGTVKPVSRANCTSRLALLRRYTNLKACASFMPRNLRAYKDTATHIEWGAKQAIDPPMSDVPLQSDRNATRPRCAWLRGERERRGAGHEWISHSSEGG